jgi:tetratricopeptide (TPR) repeat protein
MATRILSHTASGLAFLVVLIPSFGTAAGTLREEAASYRQQGYEAQRRGDAASAMMWYQKAAALDAAYPTPHNDIGVLLEQEGRLQEAEQAYRQALALNPGYLDAHANLAMLYERMGDQQRAIQHWMKRYEMGEGSDPWTARAEERLLALGVLETHPGLKARIYNRRHVVSQELHANAQSIDDFRALTNANDNWPDWP